MSGAFGLSPAYGAFIAGLIIGNSNLRTKVIPVIEPIQSVLLVVFFLSIGLLIDLTYIWQNLGVVFGAKRGEELADATVAIVSLGTGKAVARGRTYIRSTSNPKLFEVPPGRYRIDAKTVGKDSVEKQVEVEVKAGETSTETVDFGEGGSQ